jgi:hypothetical protein
MVSDLPMHKLDYLKTKLRLLGRRASRISLTELVSEKVVFNDNARPGVCTPAETVVTCPDAVGLMPENGLAGPPLDVRNGTPKDAITP